MSERFGKGCAYLSVQRDINNDIVLLFCNNKNNPEGTEGNCREDICPKMTKMWEDWEGK